MGHGAPPRLAGGTLERMDDLRIPPGPGCPRGLVVPAGELIERFSHASGPGGQGVNTADSRVQLSLDLGSTSALGEKQRERALSALGERLTGTVLTITAAETRSQRRNRAAARERDGERARRAPHVEDLLARLECEQFQEPVLVVAGRVSRERRGPLVPIGLRVPVHSAVVCRHEIALHCALSACLDRGYVCIMTCKRRFLHGNREF